MNMTDANKDEELVSFVVNIQKVHVRWVDVIINYMEKDYV